MIPNPKLLLLACAAALLAAAPAQALRVVTWNLTEYDDNYPTTNITPRQADFRTVIAGLQPDVLIAQEVMTGTARDSFLTNVLNLVQPGQWSSSYIATTQSAVFWRTAAASVTTVTSFTDGGPRDVLQCWVHPAGYTDKMGTFRLYSIHLKAGGPGTADSTTRRVECTNIRNKINTQPQTVYGPNFLLGGDTNFYGAYEGGYIRLTESQTNNNGQCHDTLGTAMPGNWHVIYAYRYWDTQSPNISPPYPYFSGGGLDDRFDIVFTSNSVQDGQGLDLDGYVTYGNDGLHFNDDVNGGGMNAAVGLTIATALRNSSDHLPVVAVLRLPAKVAAASQLDFGRVIVGGAAEQALAIANGASPPADSLRYGFVAPAGFTAPSGTFAQAAGAPPASQTIGMSTAAVGSRLDTLVISSNDVDSSLKRVILSGRVLRHAAASLESLTVVTADTLDFGDMTKDSFVDRDASVFDCGYDASQAKLAVSAGSVSGGGGHFAIAGGFSPALVAGTPVRYPIHFDTTGVAVDTTYYATLTFTSADEALPGASPQPDLLVTLRARPVHSNADVPVGGPTALRFYPPHPNPSGGPIRFAFDLPAPAPVRLEVFDLSGRRVASLASGETGAGHHELSWNAGGRAAGAAGLYFARFSTPGLSRTVRLVVLP